MSEHTDETEVTRSRSWAEFFLKLDADNDGRRARIIIVLSGILVGLAPMLDRTMDDFRQFRIGGNAVRNLSHFQMAGFELFSFLSMLAFLVVGGGLLLGRLVALSSGDEGTRSSLTLRALGKSLFRRIRIEWSLLRHMPSVNQAALLFGVVFVSLHTTRLGLSFIRWFSWKWLVVPLGREEAFLGRFFEQMYAFEGNMLFLSGVTLLIALISSLWFAFQPARRHTGGSLIKDFRDVAGSPGMLSLEDAAKREHICSAYHGERCREVLELLGAWKLKKDSENANRDDLEAYLRRNGVPVQPEQSFQVEGMAHRRRIDLVIDDAIAIELKYNLHRKGAAEVDRALSQMQEYARFWTGPGPVWVFLMNTASSSEIAKKFEDAAHAWNQRLTSDGSLTPLLVLTHTPR